MNGKNKDERGLQSIPGIGPSLAEDLRFIGIDRPSCLKGKDPEKLYRKLEKVTEAHQDRCVLYTFRCAVYFVNEKHHTSKLLKWWNWSDMNMKKWLAPFKTVFSFCSGWNWSDVNLAMKKRSLKKKILIK